MTATRWQALLIFFGGLFLFTICLGSREIIGFESRFYLFALEMWRHGPSWFPTTYQQPYPDYPALSTYLIYLFSSLTGHLNKFSAVFPSAFASAITLMMTYLIGALHSRRWGLAAALFLLFTMSFFVEARTISLDQYVTAITTLVFYLVYSASLLNKPRRVLWIFPLFVLGFAFRGPIGLIVPVGVVCVFYLLDRDFKRFFIVGVIAALLLVVCSAILFLLAKHVGGDEFFADVLRMEVLGRMQNVRTPPFYFYFKEAFGAYAISYPLAILMLISMARQSWTTQKSHLLIKLLGWALVVLIGLSIPADKKIRYILPMTPALALICGYLFFAAREQIYLTIIRSMFVWFCFYFPMLCLVALLLVQHRFPEIGLCYKCWIVYLFAVQVVMFFVLRRAMLVFMLAVLVFMTTDIGVVEPINLYLNRTRSFVVEVENLRHSQGAQLVIYHEHMDGLAIKYLINMPQEEKPIFAKNAEELAKITNPVFVVSSVDNANQIPRGISLSVVAHGKVGRESVVVFSKNAAHPEGEF